ncbi:MAG: dihydropteroate synthase [Sediminibacterium sp.]
MNSSASLPLVMGILNVTPDSFYAGSRSNSEKYILFRVEKMISDGMDILDLGGQSTRPGAVYISSEEELNRVLPLVRSIRKEFPALTLSIDTFYSDVALPCIHEGAQWINDVSGGRMDSKLWTVAGETQCTYVLMHSRGDSSNMKDLAHYENVVEEVYAYFQMEIGKLNQLGVSKIVLDLGFGFAKNKEHNFDLLQNLERFKSFGLPILVGVSRKKMIQQTLGTTAEESLNGTTALNAFALDRGADILRVHDVLEAKQAVELYSALTFRGQ